MAKKKLPSEDRAWLAVRKKTANSVKKLQKIRGDRNVDETVLYLIAVQNVHTRFLNQVVQWYED